MGNKFTAMDGVYAIPRPKSDFSAIPLLQKCFFEEKSPLKKCFSLIFSLFQKCFYYICTRN